MRSTISSDSSDLVKFTEEILNGNNFCAVVALTLMSKSVSLRVIILDILPSMDHKNNRKVKIKHVNEMLKRNGNASSWQQE